MWQPSRAHQPLRSDDKLMQALAAILEDATLEPAFIALSLVPPGEGDIARELGHDIDPDAIFRARAGLRAAIGEQLGPALTALYDRMDFSGGYSPDAKSAGRRALRNVAIDLLAATGKSAGHCPRVSAIRDSRQHDRPHGGARDSVAARCTRAPARSFRFLYALCFGCAGGGQMVFAPGHNPAAKYARKRARSRLPTPRFRSLIRTVYAR